MNLSKTRKQDIIDMFVDLSSRHVVLQAALEARSAERDALCLEVKGLNNRLDDIEREFTKLQARSTEQARAAQLIATRGELLARMRSLAAQGVPCIMRGEVVYHAKTLAILARIGGPI